MVDELGLQEGQVITKQQGNDWFNKKYPKIKEGTISAHFIKLSTNARTRIHYNANPDNNLFFRLMVAISGYTFLERTRPRYIGLNQVRKWFLESIPTA